jgi:D-alanine-D-alanine ligase
VRVCLLTNQAIDSEDFPEDDWPCDPRPYLPNVDWHLGYIEDKETSVQEVEALVDMGFDLFFNLCDGSAVEEDNPGVEVVETLDRLGVPYTGANAEFWEPSRAKTKQVCRSLGIHTPASIQVGEEECLEKVFNKLNFPLFVKHYSSYASVDISRHSKVTTEAGLWRQVNKIISKHGAALIEEFIEGDECTVLVAENPQDPDHPIAFTPIQYQFPDGDTFKHESLKWDEKQFRGLRTTPVEDPVLAARLRKESSDLFRGLNGAGFARCDIRIAKDGTPYMLEINANCGIYYPDDAAGSADFILANDPAGHVGFTQLLVDAAFARFEREKKSKRVPQSKVAKSSAA